jgi:transposase
MIVIPYNGRRITMTKPLSVDLRDRVARYVLAGHSRRQAAKVFGIGVSSAIRYVAQYLKTGTVAPAKQGGDRRSKLRGHEDFVVHRVLEVPDISLAELAEELAARGVRIHPSNLCRFLLTHGFTYKKNAARGRAETPGRLAAAR